MKKLFTTALMQECNLIFSIAGFDAVKIYLKLVEDRFEIGTDEEKIKIAKNYRKELLNYYRDIKL